MGSNDKNVTIIGIGRLGICTGLVWENKGYNVLGVDIVHPYVESINNKTFDSKEPKVTDYLKASKNLRATTSIDEGVNHSDLLFVLVDTPTGVGEKSYDHSKLSRVISSLNDRKLVNKHVIIGCTVLPGYIANTARILLRDCTNTTLSYNPEFIAQGDIINGFLKPDIVLIGQGNKEVGDRLEDMYLKVCENTPRICRMSPESAEITKLSINCFITTKIAFCNTIGDIADHTPNANKFDILQAVGGDSRVGLKCLKPGYGFGGPCFPRDNRALGNYARSVNINPLLPEATDQSNKLHAQLMIKDYLKQNLDKYVFEDVAYKEGCQVPIIEESQKLEVARGLVRAGKKVLIRDRKIIIREVILEFGNQFEYEITDDR